MKIVTLETNNTTYVGLFNGPVTRKKLSETFKDAIVQDCKNKGKDLDDQPIESLEVSVHDLQVGKIYIYDIGWDTFTKIKRQK